MSSQSTDIFISSKSITRRSITVYSILIVILISSGLLIRYPAELQFHHAKFQNNSLYINIPLDDSIKLYGKTLYFKIHPGDLSGKTDTASGTIETLKRIDNDQYEINIALSPLNMQKLESVQNLDSQVAIKSKSQNIMILLFTK
jgi:hypothetical protein